MTIFIATSEALANLLGNEPQPDAPSNPGIAAFELTQPSAKQS